MWGKEADDLAPRHLIASPASESLDFSALYFSARMADGRLRHTDGWRPKDGKVLLKKNLGDPIGGGIVIYEIAGVPYVAVAGGMKNTVTQQTDSGPAWVAILELPK